MTARVMIVEDEFLIALDLENMVERFGMEVAGLASTTRNARLLAPYADIALVDVNLADGPTGPEIGEMLARDYGISVIFMTGNPEMVGEGVPGALGVVAKPVMPDIVEGTLKYAQSRRQGGIAAVPRDMTVFKAA